MMCVSVCMCGFCNVCVCVCVCVGFVMCLKRTMRCRVCVCVCVCLCVLWAFLGYSHELSVGCISISEVCVNSCSDHCSIESKLATCLGHSCAAL